MILPALGYWPGRTALIWHTPGWDRTRMDRVAALEPVMDDPRS
jgi:hypothetical protein